MTGNLYCEHDLTAIFNNWLASSPIINTTLLIRRGTPEAWAASDYILKKGEPGWDGSILKIGDDVSLWPELRGFDLAFLSSLALLDTISDVNRDRRIAADSYRSWGHSYPRGAGAPGVFAGTNDFSTLCAEQLGLMLRNEAMSGAVLFNHTSALCNWVNVLQKTATLSRWSKPGGLHVTMWGINDLVGLGNTPQALSPFKMAYRSVISRLRASRVFENDDPSVVLGGAGVWSTSTGTTNNSGTNVRYNTTTVGSTITITTPVDFPGGLITLGFVAYPADGAVVSGIFNGVTYTLNTNDFAQPGGVQSAAARTCSVIRIPNVPAGVNVLTFTGQSKSGAIGLMFDYWSWEPEELDCPLVVLVEQPKPIDYSQYVGSFSVPTDAGVDALNLVLNELTTEFDSRVITVDVSSMDKSPVYFVPGDIHPTIAGHYKLKELIFKAIVDKIDPSPAPQRLSKRLEYRSSVPTAADRNYVVGDKVENTTPTPGGYVGWTCVVAGAPGTWKGFGIIEA